MRYSDPIPHPLTTLSEDKQSPIDHAYQLVTACHVEELLKGEILGSSNAKHINNLYGEVSEGFHVRD